MLERRDTVIEGCRKRGEKERREGRKVGMKERRDEGKEG